MYITTTTTSIITFTNTTFTAVAAAPTSIHRLITCQCLKQVTGDVKAVARWFSCSCVRFILLQMYEQMRFLIIVM